MKFTYIESDKEEVIAYGKEKNHLIKTIEELCLMDTDTIIGYSDSFVKKMNIGDIECFFTLSEKVYALCEGEKYQVKKRLYELSEMYQETFIYINQGCLANMNYIDYFDVSISGTLLVYFKSGYKDYASRRKIKYIKERMGIK